MTYLTKTNSLIKIFLLTLVFNLVFSFPLVVLGQDVNDIGPYSQTLQLDDLDNLNNDYDNSASLLDIEPGDEYFDYDNSASLLDISPNQSDIDMLNFNQSQQAHINEFNQISNDALTGDEFLRIQAQQEYQHQQDTESTRRLSESQNRQTLKISEGINPLYPQKGHPNNISVESAAIDAVSCLTAIMGINAAYLGFELLDNLSSSVLNAADTGGDGLSVWFGVGALLGLVGENKTRSGLDIKEDSHELFGIKILPGKDSIAFCTKNMLLAYLQASVIKWVNSAFNEGAAFVEDFEKAFNDVANIAFEEAIGEVNVCGYVKATVDLSALADLMRTRPRAPSGRCTVSFDREFELVLSGDSFNYADFESLYSNPRNNGLGATLLVNSVTETKREVYNKVFKKDTENGWWPWKDANGRTVTPGTAIENAVLEKLNMSNTSFAIADEFDEVVFMIFNQLIKTNLEDSFGI